MRYYLFDTVGFEYGSYATFADAYEAMHDPWFGSTYDLFITTKENPWE